jgi:hypothetical protein
MWLFLRCLKTVPQQALHMFEDFMPYAALYPKLIDANVARASISLVSHIVIRILNSGN